MTAFFITQPLGVHERPYRAIADLETTLGQFHDQAAQREVARTASLEQPVTMLASDPLRPVSADLSRGCTSGRTMQAIPATGGRCPESTPRLLPAQASSTGGYPSRRADLAVIRGMVAADRET
jgi:hypothetical protein